ncbi:branched-chain amino acid ABC transporter ATP-binding protein/permease [Limnohabitans sp. Jir72]|uniref:branched-chain amino acid ABC transporter ATP-binding protein/permease n=1 Tax=Limnohabitans sp. Jir72 TaxID=1977909 RepID=UPI000D3D422A|nr:branched-chain amino acid ABC transporter ATP-binding protein/permease [Limnohabitans sp. Jir72]PUE26481.1 branched-chain amino acid ABC transporter permease [Limnohabitans sp. Jir72]
MNKIQRISLLFVVLALLFAAPYLGLPVHLQSLLYVIFFWMTLATSWNMLSGYSGYFSFGHGAFFGVGMYGMATLAAKADWPVVPAALGSGVLAALLALAIGALVFNVRKIRGESFALITLAVGFVLATVVVNTPIDGGPGVYLMGVNLPQWGPKPASTFYYASLVLTVLCVAAAWWLFHARAGLGLLAIHDDEDAAEVNGVPTFWLKMGAFALSSFFAGVMGGIHALYVSYVTVGETFNITVPLTVVLMSVLGGSRHWAGPMLGGILITLLLNAFTAGESALVGKMIIGLVLAGAVLVMPRGILGTWQLRQHKRLIQRSQNLSGDAHTSDHGNEEAVVIERPLSRPAEAADRTLVLQVRGLSKQFSGIRALNQVDLDLYQGEILGLLGPNGSGKSTFINVVTGHYKPTEGTVLLRGQSCAGWPAHRIRRQGLSRTYQIPRPFNGLTVLQNVTLAAHYGGARLTDAQAQAEAQEWMLFTGLQDKGDHFPDELNLHQRKFLELARALAARPQVLLLDEVLSGLTPSEIGAAVQTIRRIRERGTSIVFVEHVMSAVLALSDRLVVLNQGEVIAEGPPQDVMSRPEVVRAYLGDEAAV